MDELRLTEEQKKRVLGWAVRVGDSVLDYLFMTYLPLPFLAGHSLRLALQHLPQPLRTAVQDLCYEYERDLQPTGHQLFDSSANAMRRAVRQLMRVGWAILGVRILPELVRRAIDASSGGEASLGHRTATTASSSASRAVRGLWPQPEQSLSANAGNLAAWVSAGLMSLMQGVWSGHQLTNNLLEYHNKHPANFLPFLFPEHFDVSSRVQNAIDGGLEWLGLAAPSDQRQEQRLKEYLARLLLHALTVQGYFSWLCWMTPKNSVANIWAKILGVAYFILYLPSHGGQTLFTS